MLIPSFTRLCLIIIPESSWSIISCLRRLADSGQAILCTIHQPSSSLFEQFDRILLLEKGGRCVYFGNIGPKSRDVINYFETRGAARCSLKTNPAECKSSLPC
jgi:ABC-type multidrug transport system ATPase subunit